MPRRIPPVFLLGSTALILSVLASGSALAAKGWTATQVSSAQGGATNEATLTYESGRLRIDAGTKSYVLEFKANNFLFIDHDSKKYASASLDEVVALQNKIMSDMKKSVAGLPSPQREMAEAQIAKFEKGLKAQAQPNVTKTGKKDTVNGYACEVVVWTDAMGENEACVAVKMPVDVSAFLEESRALSKRLAEKGASNATPTQALLNLPGFPVQTKRTEAMGPTQMVSTTQIKDIKPFDAGVDTFAAPKVYQKGSLSSIIAPGM